MMTDQHPIQKWRELDILEVLDEFKRIAALSCSTEQLNAAQNLPSSLQTLLLNSVMPLRKLAGTPLDCEDLVARKLNPQQIPPIDRVALPRGFNEVLRIDKPQLTIKIAEPEQPKEPDPLPVNVQVNEVSQGIVQEITNPVRKPPIMTTKSNPHGRQWFVGNVLAAEVQYIDGIGHVCRKWTGKHVSNQKPYSTYDTAASEARSHADGVMYLMGLP